MRKNGEKFNPYKLIIILTAIVCALILLALFVSIQGNVIYGTLGALKAWIANIMVVSALVFLLLLIRIRKLVKKTSKENSERLKKLRSEIKDTEMLRRELRRKENQRVGEAAELITGVKAKPLPTAAERTEEGRTSRFYKLSETDREMESYRAPEYDNEITLEQICESFRAFAASKLKLYYEISVVREFVASLAVTRLVIMQGMSGTGKTSMVYAFGEFLKNSSVIVPIQPSWKERSDLLGYFNEFTKRFNETELLQKLYEAGYNDEMYMTVLDEMNIARVEYYFAEFLSLLEFPNPEGWYIDIVSDSWESDPRRLKKGRLRLPENMWYVGTANNDDSTFAISDKVYDRAMVLNLDRKAQPFEAKETEGIKLSRSHYERLAADAKHEYGMTGRVRRKLEELNDYLGENLQISFGNRIMKQIENYIPVYLACGGSELEALDDILAKKVLRKLESQNLIYVRNAADGLCAYLDDLFGADKMKSCKRCLRKFEMMA